MIAAFSPRIPWRYGAAFALVVLSTGFAEIIYSFSRILGLSSVFLAGVLVAAFWLGSGPAYFASVLAVFAYNFYILGGRTPLSFAPGESVLTLGMFLTVAMLTGGLTGRVRDQAQKAGARARATQALYDATREFSGSADEDFISERLAHHLAAAARARALVVTDRTTFAAPSSCWSPHAVLQEARGLRSAKFSEELRTIYTEGWTLRLLHADGAALGAAAWQAPAAGPLPRDEQTLLEILADAGAAAVARARLAAAKASAEARARTEELRNALLSSISHDLRTPLAAIMASASSLQEFGETFDATTRQDLAATIQEESERMNAFVSNLLNMTRLEAGAVTVQRTRFGLQEVVERTLRRQRLAHRGAVIEAALLPELEAFGDPLLFEQALGNVMENAIRFSPAGAVVRIAGERGVGAACVRVTDDGPGVPAADLGRIFDKFYRSPGAAQSAGTGLGLSIARGFMEAMGGTVTASNRPAPHRGLVVTLKLGLAAG